MPPNAVLREPRGLDPVGCRADDDFLERAWRMLPPIKFPVAHQRRAAPPVFPSGAGLSRRKSCWKRYSFSFLYASCLKKMTSRMTSIE